MSDITSASTEIKGWGKFFAGLTLIFFIVSAIITLIAFWPDQMPENGKGADSWYTATAFSMTLIKPCACDTAVEKDTSKATQAAVADTGKVADTVNQKIKPAPANTANLVSIEKPARIHINTILLVLVAVMGFLGNMVHIATSFTTFVGNGQFKKSWILWYFVKPFTAAALAVIVYFIIRAGFLSYGSDASNVSLFGILALSAMAGLFTDSATLKLKEVFDVIFKPKDDRGDRLGAKEFKITKYTPEELANGTENTIVLTGENLDQDGVTIAIGSTVIVTATKTSASIQFKYTPVATDIKDGKVELIIKNKEGTVVYQQSITVN